MLSFPLNFPVNHFLRPLRLDFAAASPVCATRSVECDSKYSEFQCGTKATLTWGNLGQRGGSRREHRLGKLC